MSDFRRQHPVAAITRLMSVIRQNFITLLIVLFIGSTGNRGDYFWYLLLFGLGTALVVGVLGWVRFSYRVRDGELQIKKGVFVRNKLYLSKDRIQVIDITQGLIQRIFGLVKLEVKSAGSGTDTATISAISRDEAERLRKKLRNEDFPVESELAVPDEDLNSTGSTQKEIEEWELNRKDLIIAAFTSGNFGLIASVLGAISGQLDEFITEERLTYIYDMLPGYNNVMLIVGLVVVIIVVSWLLSFLGVIFKYSDFQIEKGDKELIITSGLLEKKHITIPYNRIQAIRVVEGIIRQPFGYGMVYVESAGFDQNKKERSIVLVPFIRADKIQAFMNRFLPDFKSPEFDITPPERSFSRYLRHPNYSVIAISLLMWMMWEYGWLFLIFIPAAASLGWVRYKDAALALGESLIRMRYRVLGRTTAIVKRNRIQNVELSSNPFQQRKDLKTLKITAASGARGIQFEIRDLDASDALKAYRWINYHEKEITGAEEMDKSPEEEESESLF